MKIHCPYCGCDYVLEVKAHSEYTRNQEIVIHNFFGWLKGVKPYRGHFEQIDTHTYKFRQQTFSSPEGGTEVMGEITWYPGMKLEFSKEKIYNT